MMKTLFLQPPSFDGFDGGAGSRYQARREIRSFWYPTWLAQPAALVPGSKLIDAPPAGIGLDTVTRAAREHELCVIHTSTPSFAVRREGGGGAEGGEPGAEDRPGRRQGGGAAGREPGAGRADRLRGAQRVRLHHQGNRRGPRLGCGGRHLLPQRRRRDHPQQGSRDPRGHGPTAVRHRGLQARPADRGLLHRLSACIPMCRCTPAAAANRAAPSACGRRPWAGIATGCARRATWRRRSRWRSGISRR